MLALLACRPDVSSLAAPDDDVWGVLATDLATKARSGVAFSSPRGEFSRVRGDNTSMKAALVFAALVCLLLVTPGSTQADMAGEWAVSFTTPQGPQEFTMYVVQEGTRLNGRLTSEYGEFPLRGTLDGSDFTITWSIPDGGRILEITFTGKVDGDSMTGTAKLGTRGSGELSGTRTGPVDTVTSQ